MNDAVIAQGQCDLFQEVGGGSSPTSPLQFSKKEYRVVRIEQKLGQSISIANHYLHRTAPCSIALGLKRSGVIVGIALYGTPSNRNLRTGICGPDEADNVIELSRLWIEDGEPTNAESFLIAHSLRFLNKEIVVSYADQSVGHIGTVYKASGWLYTGLSAKRPEYTVRGMEHQHKQSLFDGLGRDRDIGKSASLFGDEIKSTSQVELLRSKYGDALVIGQQVRKHRYVRFLGGRKKELLAKLRYPLMPYPTQHRDTGVLGVRTGAGEP